MRTRNSMKNILIGIAAQIIITLLGFVSRKVFLDSLGANYLGLNGLLTNVLSFLALVEGGVGASIVYSLYQPLAENNRPKIIALVQVYKKAYQAIALIVIALSILLYPFLGLLIQKSDPVSYVRIVYFLFVAKNIVLYLNAHKVSLITADQKGYVLVRINLFFQIMSLMLKIFLILYTKNYALYLLLELIIFVVQNIYYGKIIEHRYPFVRTKSRYRLGEDEKPGLIRNIKALFLQNLGTYFVFGTDNILIGSLIGLVAVGVFSNYTMIIAQLNILLAPFMNGVSESVGNMIALESKEKSHSLFKVIYLLNFWIYSVSFIFLYNVLQNFISWWLGEEYLLNSFALIVLLSNFYITGMRGAATIFKTKAGIFTQDKYVPLLEALVNLIASVLLGRYFGVAGILLGTAISTLCTAFWNIPRLVYKYYFEKSVWMYFKQYIFYLVLTSGACWITYYMNQFMVNGHGFSAILLKGMVSLLVPNVLYVIIFYPTAEFQYVKQTISTMIVSRNLKSTFPG
ncbi:lipopolysaccharide biosynthesis protein [Falsibacillus albus]|uniref:Flippase n=1 Tax=Falsibacillus albus TaxID=2478915 RepID=A0A3L7K1P3_9BACI|nr:hypothetical protein [Falsibacillus albus]RLQ96274.1 hypothetical protein D9X91_08290 [Falsibacillus albus]